MIAQIKMKKYQLRHKLRSNKIFALNFVAEENQVNFMVDSMHYRSLLSIVV